MAEDDTILIIAAVGVGAYMFWKYLSGQKEEQREQSIGKAAANASALVPEYNIKAADTSINPKYGIVRELDASDSITSYRIDPSTLNPYQKLAYEKGWFTVQNGVFKPNIPYIPFI